MQKDIYWNIFQKIRKIEMDFNELLKRELSAHKIPRLTVEMMYLLYNLKNKKIIVNELYRQEIYMGSNVSYTLKKLEEVGLIMKLAGADVEDQRCTYIELSPTGISLVKKIDTIIEANAQFFFKVSIQQDEVSFLQTLLTKIESYCYSCLKRNY